MDMKLTIVFVLVLSAALGGEAVRVRKKTSLRHQDKAGVSQAGPFGYAQGGADWGGLSATCKNGKMQSPIDIMESSVAKSAFAVRKARFYYHQRARLLNNGRALQVVPPDASADAPFGYMVIDEAAGVRGKFIAKSLLFHSPSEHLVAGEPFDVEMQIRHEREGTGEIAMVSLFFNADDTASTAGEDDSMDLAIKDDPATDASNEDVFLTLGETAEPRDGLLASSFFKTLNWDGAPSTVGAEVPVSDRPNLNFFDLTLQQQYFHYIGSLTTPPCTETVQWHVFPYEHKITTAQVNQVKRRFLVANTTSAYSAASSPRGKQYWQGNQRWTQPLGARQLTKAPALADAAPPLEEWSKLCRELDSKGKALCLKSHRSLDSQRCCWFTGGDAKIGACRVLENKPASSTADADSHWSCQSAPASCATLTRYGRDSCLGGKQANGSNCCWYTGGAAETGSCAIKFSRPEGSIVDSGSNPECLDSPTDCGHLDRYGVNACVSSKRQDGQQCCWYLSAGGGQCRSNSSRPTGSTVHPNSAWVCQDPPAVCSEISVQRFGDQALDACTQSKQKNGARCCYYQDAAKKTTYCGTTKPVPTATVHADSHYTCQDPPINCYQRDRYGFEGCVNATQTNAQQCCWFVKDELGRCRTRDAKDKNQLDLEGYMPDRRSNWKCLNKPKTCDEFTQFGRDACVATVQADDKRCCWWSNGASGKCAIRGSQPAGWALDAASNWTCMAAPATCDERDKFGKGACVNTSTSGNKQCCFYVDGAAPIAAVASGDRKGFCRTKFTPAGDKATWVMDADSDWTCQDPASDCRELDRYTNNKQACILSQRVNGQPCCYYYSQSQGGRCRNNGTKLADFALDATSPWQCQPPPEDCTTFTRYGKSACTAVKQTKTGQQCCWYSAAGKTMCSYTGTRLPGFTLENGNPSGCS